MSGERERYEFLIGTGGIGWGMFLALRGNQTLGRSESRAGRMLDRRDFCKLHIVAHYVAALTGSGSGLEIFPIGKVGDDPAGRELTEHMRRAGMDARFVTVEPGARTLFSVCLVYPDGDGGNVTTDDSASARVTAAEVQRAVHALANRRGGIAVAVPEVPLEARARLLELARQRGWLTAAAVTTGEATDPVAAAMLRHVDVLGANHDEAAALAGLSPGRAVETIARAAGEKLARHNPSIRLCVTAGAAGSVGWTGGQMEYTPPPPVEVVNTAGAGDASLAGLIVATAAGLPFLEPRRPRRQRLTDAPLATAVDFAALLAALAVTSEDTINFDADADALRALADRIGTDVGALAPALQWP